MLSRVFLILVLVSLCVTHIIHPLHYQMDSINVVHGRIFRSHYTINHRLGLEKLQSGSSVFYYFQQNQTMYHHHINEYSKVVCEHHYTNTSDIDPFVVFRRDCDLVRTKINSCGNYNEMCNQFILMDNHGTLITYDQSLDNTPYSVDISHMDIEMFTYFNETYVDEHEFQMPTICLDQYRN
jgi:hypothetical protein